MEFLRAQRLYLYRAGYNSVISIVRYNVDAYICSFNEEANRRGVEGGNGGGN